MEAAIAAARREAKLAFGSDAVFLEKYWTGCGTSRCRSSATSTATWCTCYERDCSVQRRHQKVIEFAPARTSPTRRARAHLSTPRSR